MMLGGGACGSGEMDRWGNFVDNSVMNWVGSSIKFREMEPECGL